MNETAVGTGNLKQSCKEPVHVLLPKKHVIGQQLTVIHIHYTMAMAISIQLSMWFGQTNSPKPKDLT